MTLPRTSPECTSSTHSVSPLHAVALLGALLVGVCIPLHSSADAATKTVTTKSGVVTHGSIKTTSDTIGWLLTCPVSHSLSDDPITMPGMPGMAHLHDFTGNASTNASSTLASMEQVANQASSTGYAGGAVRAGTSCNLPTYSPGTAGDTASYWRPALFVNGKKVTPTVKDQLYYRAKPTFGTQFQAIPQDARLIVGTAAATSVATNQALVDGRIYWEDSNGKKSQEAPSTSSFLLNVVFPSCWDGRPMDHSGPSGTDNNHFAYASDSGACPSGFTTKVAQLSEKFKYDNVPSGLRELASMNSTGRAATYTAHADFWNTWNPVALEYLTQRCLNAALSCGTNPMTPLK